MHVDGIGTPSLSSTRGVRRGERLSIGSTFHTVIEGFVSNSEGDVTIFPALAAAAANNAAVASLAVKPSVFCDPSTLAWAMRPTSPPTPTGNSDITTMVDSETGFALTFEANRLKRRTVFTISCIFDAAVIRDEQVHVFTGVADA